MSNTQKWYIVKKENNTCQIVALKEDPTFEIKKYWGPFVSPEEAIAARVGLIRAKKCQPS